MICSFVKKVKATDQICGTARQQQLSGAGVLQKFSEELVVMRKNSTRGVGRKLFDSHFIWSRCGDTSVPGHHGHSGHSGWQ